MWIGNQVLAVIWLKVLLGFMVERFFGFWGFLFPFSPGKLMDIKESGFLTGIIYF